VDHLLSKMRRRRLKDIDTRMTGADQKMTRGDLILHLRTLLQTLRSQAM